jgi:parallel beta-helix repeat protein
MTLLFLVSISSLTLEVQRVKASGTIYIRADGRIAPPTAELSSNDNVTYLMTGNLNSSIVIEKDNIVFFGAGYAIQGSGSGNGIELSGRNNVTIENVEVRGFYQGIMIFNFSSYDNIFGVRTVDNSYGGIRIDSSTDNNVTGNIIVRGEEGIELSGAENNLVCRNSIEGNTFYGLNLISTSNNLIDGNNVSNCAGEGIKLWMSSNNNTVIRNRVAQCEVGIEVSYSSNSNLILQNDFSMNNWSAVNIGFLIPESGPDWGGAADNRIIENNVTHNNLGIELIYSKNNTIFNNNVEENNSSVTIIGSYFNIWDDEAIGNYWSDYNGTDVNHDGIGDSAYAIDANNTDLYPLMGMFNKYNVTYFTPSLVPHYGNVTVISNSSISGFVAPIWIEHPEIIILTFNVTGTNGSTGFCRVSIPTIMMNGTYHVFVNGTEISYTLLPCSDADYSYLYFSYPHSTEAVTIIPEFLSFLVLSFFIMATLIVAIVYKKRLTRS